MKRAKKARRSIKKPAPPASGKRSQALALSHAVKIVRVVCAVAGSPDLLRSPSSIAEKSLTSAIRIGNSPTLYDYLADAFSYQGISDEVAFTYMERHGRITWDQINAAMAKRPSCPKLQHFWSFVRCGYNKTRRTCSEPGHIGRCPLPRHRLRHGRLNQTTYSLFLFVRDIAQGDLVGWINQRLQTPRNQGASQASENLIGPLRAVYGVSDKVLNMTLSTILMAAPRSMPRWGEVGISMVAIDTLVHNFLHRTGVLNRFNAMHRYGPACYRPLGCADLIQRIAAEIDARKANPKYPRIFPRFVQHAIWRFCALSELDICNGNNIADDARCTNSDCYLFAGCDRQPLHDRPTSQLSSPTLITSKVISKENSMAAKKPQKAKPSKSPIDPGKAFCVMFGRDDKQKPRAARIADYDLNRANKAARMQGLRVSETTYAHTPEILKRLPAGRLYKDGKALVPIVSEETLELIVTIVGDVGQISPTMPKTPDEVAPGHLVLAQESASDGWWEAVVIERSADLLKIKWRDFPSHEATIRAVGDVALICQSAAKAAEPD